MSEEKKIFVNLVKGEATVQILKKVPLFDSPAKRFILESDAGGFSCVEKRADGYHYVNYLRDSRLPIEDWTIGTEVGIIKPVEDRRISAYEASKLIRATLSARY